MKHSVAANYDPEIIPRRAEYSLEDVYGKLPLDIFGSRPSYMSRVGFVPEEGRHDALLSIRKGFRANELYRLLKSIKNVNVIIKKYHFSRLVAFIRFNGGSQ